MDSILTSVKKLLGIAEDYDHFDPDIIMHINTAFSLLHQLGYGPEEGFRIEDETTEWSEYLQNDANLNLIKDYIFMKVRALFDPPSSSSLLDAINRQIAEFEWRINAVSDFKDGDIVE